ncbi:MAG: LysM peptidoglycan-binding domain-containing protein [Granulosicoccaceae bacterium]
MIQKTDLLILVLATAGLSVGIYRWHENTQNVSAVTIPASSMVVIPAPEMPPEPTNVGVSASVSDTETVVAAQIEAAHSITPAQNEFLEHVVRSGDSLSRIATRYSTDVSTLQRLNRIDGTAIYAGQTLIYPISVN